MSCCPSGVHLAVVLFVAALCAFGLEISQSWHCAPQSFFMSLAFYFPVIVTNNVFLLALLLWVVDVTEGAGSESQRLTSKRGTGGRRLDAPPSLQTTNPLSAMEKNLAISFYDNVPQTWEYNELTQEKDY